MKRIALIVVAIVFAALTGCKDTASVGSDRYAMASEDIPLALPGEVAEGAVSTDIAPEIPVVENLPGSNDSRTWPPTEKEFPGLIQGAITPSPDSAIEVHEVHGRLVRHCGLLYLQYFIKIKNTSNTIVKDLEYRLIINEQESRSDSMVISHKEVYIGHFGSLKCMAMTPEPIKPMERLHSLRAEIVGFRGP